MLAALALAASLAPADRAHIDWIAPPSCPSAADVDALAERLLLVADGAVEARAEVRADAEGFALELAIGDRTQRFDARECEALARVTALLVAVAADPLAVAVATTGPLVRAPAVSEPVAPTSSRARIEIARPPATAATPRPIERTRRIPVAGWLGVHGIVGVAELPGLDAGIGLAGAVERGAFAAELRASWLFERRAGIPERPGAEAGLSAANASARACGILGRPSLRAVLCAGPELGAVIGRAYGVTDSQRAVDLWIAASAAPSLHVWPHPRVGVQLGVDLVLALRRPEFALSDDSSLRVSTGRGGLRAWGGIAVRFGGKPSQRARSARSARREPETHDRDEPATHRNPRLLLADRLW